MDFVSAGTMMPALERGLPPDALGHEGVARQLCWAVGRLPVGSVVGVQGGWGRGKTDVLTRLMARSQGAGGSSGLWINPWQYGTPDLLSPLVLALLERLSPERRASQQGLRKAAQSVVLAGLSFGLKATRSATPGGSLLLDAADATAGMLQPLFAAADLDAEHPRPDPDPVAWMGVRFRELVAALLEEEGTDRVLICVDDLDRCLPDRQVSLLQAMRFLISAGAPATFVVALDPVLARQALLVHYQTTIFDPDQYLDKMFTLRVNLPAVSEAGVRALVLHLLPRDAVDGGLGAGWTERLADQAAAALCAPMLRNPRLVQRLADRLGLLVQSATVPRLHLENELEARWLLAWLVLLERWPLLREALQSEVAELGRRLPLLHHRSTVAAAEWRTGVAALDGLPVPTPTEGQLWRVFGQEQMGSAAVQFIARIERSLLAAGL